MTGDDYEAMKDLAFIDYPGYIATDHTHCMYCTAVLRWGNVCRSCEDERMEPGEKWGYDSDR